MSNEETTKPPHGGGSALNVELDRQKEITEYFRQELAKHAQTLHVYNNLPWYERIFIKKLTPECRFEHGFNCCCGKHKSNAKLSGARYIFKQYGEL